MTETGATRGNETYLLVFLLVPGLSLPATELAAAAFAVLVVLAITLVGTAG